MDSQYLREAYRKVLRIRCSTQACTSACGQLGWTPARILGTPDAELGLAALLGEFPTRTPTTSHDLDDTADPDHDTDDTGAVISRGASAPLHRNDRCWASLERPIDDACDLHDGIPRRGSASRRAKKSTNGG